MVHYHAGDQHLPDWQDDQSPRYEQGRDHDLGLVKHQLDAIGLL
jgi:hypothetical protein